MSINRWVDRQNVVCLYNGRLFSHQKEWSTDTYSNMNGPWMLSEKKLVTKDHTLRLHSCESPKQGSLYRQKVDKWSLRAGSMEMVAESKGFLFEVRKIFWNQLCWWLHIYVNILKVIKIMDFQLVNWRHTLKLLQMKSKGTRIAKQYWKGRIKLEESHHLIYFYSLFFKIYLLIMLLVVSLHSTPSCPLPPSHIPPL